MAAPHDPAPQFAKYAHPDKLVSTDWLAEHLDDPDVVVVESDEDVLLYDTGHIPGAVSIPWNRAVTRDGTFRPDSELREIYADFLGEAGRRVVTYCRIGERSSHTWFVLHELLDQPDVVNYDGSWVEYGSLIGVPVER